MVRNILQAMRGMDLVETVEWTFWFISPLFVGSFIFWAFWSPLNRTIQIGQIQPWARNAMEEISTSDGNIQHQLVYLDPMVTALCLMLLLVVAVSGMVFVKVLRNFATTELEFVADVKFFARCDQVMTMLAIVAFVAMLAIVAIVTAE